MTCEEYQEQLPERALGHLEEAADERLARHLSDCPECRAQWEMLQLGLADLNQWQVEDPPKQLSDRTMAAIRAEAASQSGFWARIDRALGRFAAHRPTPLTGLVTVVVTVVLLGQVLSPNLWRGRSSSDGTACKRNLKVVDQALEAYRREHSGLYPDRLSQLKPDYLRQLPDCPDSGNDSYSSGYRVSPDHQSYTLQCGTTK
ncbi:zf-HC2 domain-containing protein [bacterium]|nr:zf-HC2 domain-containing protein [bacterium]